MPHGNTSCRSPSAAAHSTTIAESSRRTPALYCNLSHRRTWGGLQQLVCFREGRWLVVGYHPRQARVVPGDVDCARYYVGLSPLAATATCDLGLRSPKEALRHDCFCAHLVRAYEDRTPLLLLVREPRSLLPLYDLELTKHHPHDDKTLPSLSSLNLRVCRLSVEAQE